MDAKMRNGMVLSLSPGAQENVETLSVWQYAVRLARFKREI
jgi:hypothetical protein